MVNISVKAAGSRRKPLEDFSVPLPPGLPENGETLLSDLIASVVRHEISNFRDRQHQRTFLHVLTHREIAAGRRAGKINSGGIDLSADSIDEQQAVDIALQAFEDGLFYCVVDGVQIEHLHQRLVIAEDSRLTFIKLTMLAGG